MCPFTRPGKAAALSSGQGGGKVTGAPTACCPSDRSRCHPPHLSSHKGREAQTNAETKKISGREGKKESSLSLGSGHSAYLREKEPGKGLWLQGQGRGQGRQTAMRNGEGKSKTLALLQVQWCLGPL